MNERGWQVVARLRKSIEMLPGAMSAAIFEGRTWTLIEVIAASDDSVYTLALLLGMGTPKERQISNSKGDYQRWLFASAEHLEPGRGAKGGGLVTVNIIGPRRRNEPAEVAP
jgi:hypothetical protein